MTRSAQAIAGHLNAPSFADELTFELSKHGLEVDKLRLEAQGVKTARAQSEAVWVDWAGHSKLVACAGFFGAFVIFVVKTHGSHNTRAELGPAGRQERRPIL